MTPFIASHGSLRCGNLDRVGIVNKEGLGKNANDVISENRYQLVLGRTRNGRARETKRE